MKSKNEKMKALELSEDFYVEELEARLEMTAAAADPGMTNKNCWVMVFN